MSERNQSDFQSELARGKEIIDKIVAKFFSGNFIFRGEAKCYDKVSSGLYRAYSGGGIIIRGQDIPGAIQASQERMLRDAKAYLDEPDPSEILTQLQMQRGTVDPDVVLMPGLETILARAQAFLGKSTDFKILASLQHYGLKTNLIDFTTNPFVALFFACNSSFDEDGRIIVLKRQSTKDFCIKEAPPIIRQAVSQRSILVEAHKGFISGPYEVIPIDKCLKIPVQKYLEESYGISTKGVYGDIHGFIRTYNIYPDPHRKLFDGQACFDNALSAEKPEEQLQEYKKAIGIFTGILESNRYFPEAYLNRGASHFQLGEHYMEANEKDKAKREYDKAITDYKAAITQDPDYAEAYAGRGKVYNSVGKFDAAAGDFDKAISLGIEDGTVHSDRCVSLMNLGKWEELRSRLTTLKNQMQKGETDEGPLNIDALLEGLAKYAEDNGIELPADIAEMLPSEGTQEED